MHDLMIGILLISENKAGHEWVKSISRMMGVQPALAAVELLSNMSAQEMNEVIHASIEALQEKEVLILTDIWGSTQCRACLPFLQKDKVEMVTGYSLPMLIKTMSIRQNQHLNDLIAAIRQYGATHIWHVVSSSDHPKA